MAAKVRFATAWLDGCSGCHMSFLDLDEALLDIADLVDVVYSPTVDTKEFPEDVDLTLIEGAVSSQDDLDKLLHIRERTNLLVALGDCAVTGNVPAMRNTFAVETILSEVYEKPEDLQAQKPCREVPVLLPQAKPMHVYVTVDRYLPGCPPPPEAIRELLMAILEGRESNIHALTRFGR